MLTLHNLKSKKGVRKKKRRLGRGNSSGRGTYCGRGQKGQRSRSGGKKGLKLKGFKQSLQKIPKSKGFKSHRPEPETTNIKELETAFKNGEIVTPLKLFEAGLISTLRNKVKILGEGKLNKKFTVRAHAFSKSAQQAIKKAGGKAEIIKPNSQGKKKNKA